MSVRSERERVYDHPTAYTRAMTDQAPTPAGPGRAVWYEINTPDLAATQDFYCALFGWEVNEQDMGGQRYAMIRNGDKDIGGFVAQDAGTAAIPHWLSYVTVDDVVTAVKKVFHHFRG